MDTVKIDPGLVHFETPGGHGFDVPVMSFSKELRDLGDAMRADYDRHMEAGEPKEAQAFGHYAYLERVIAIVKDRFGAEMTLDEVEWFKDELEVQHAKKKQRRLASISAELNSAYSMGSTASPSPTTN